MSFGSLEVCSAVTKFSCTVQQMAAPQWPGDWTKAWQERVVIAHLPYDLTLELLRHPKDRMLQRMGGHAYCQYPYGGVSVGSKWPDPWAKGIEHNRYCLLSLRMKNGKPIAMLSLARAEAMLAHHMDTGKKGEKRTGYYWSPDNKLTEVDRFTFYFGAQPPWGWGPRVIEGMNWMGLEWLPPHGLDFYGNYGGVRWDTETLTNIMEDWWNDLPTPEWAHDLHDDSFTKNITETAHSLYDQGVLR